MRTNVLYGIASPDIFRRVFHLTAGRPGVFCTSALRTMISCNIKSLQWHIMLQIHLYAACIQHTWRRRYHVLEFHSAESRVPTL